MKGLQVFEKHPGTEGAAGPVYRVGGSFTPYAIVAVDKRFTDAELAAEVHSADLTCWVRRSRCDNYPGEDALFDHYERAIEQSSTLVRFATLPHYDEETP